MGMGGNFVGGDATLQTLALLADPSRLAGKIAELRSVQEQAQAVIDLVGPASEVLALRDQTKRELDTAADARIEAERGLAQARDQADGLLVSAQARAVEIVADAEIFKSARMGEANVALARAAQREEGVQALAAANEERERELGDQATNLEAGFAKLEDERRALADERVRYAEAEKLLQALAGR